MDPLVSAASVLAAALAIGLAAIILVLVKMLQVKLWKELPVSRKQKENCGTLLLTLAFMVPYHMVW